ncbi:uncharacterized protein LOC110746523 [Prunus avium]|uniref:Uncharacterized protein LOC110746523 n=2 Tax=Prunus avium TaxID=42229 RepID=A0A6P5RHJ5_PRUAV|nr:uncharacterized protein LOC110746523 [Prunus avium]
MDQQGKCNNSDFIDFSTLRSNEATNLINSTGAWLLNEKPGAFIPEEELKIRSEVEMDIERDLEEEIKDGICHLALRLHRLYQHQKERRSSYAAALAARDERKMEKAFCEVNINIKMEGGTKIEIKETKKPAPPDQKGSGPNWSGSRSENYVQPFVKMARNSKKFDWAKTLRSNVGPVAFTKKQWKPT